jgi:hypothetical protein
MRRCPSGPRVRPRPRSCSTTPPTRSCCALSPPTRELAAIGLAILWDRSGRPLFPRWSGYIDLDVAAIFAGGAPVLFVKQGAFGWDRAIAFWAVLASFGVWVSVPFATMLRAIGPAPTAPAEGAPAVAA